MIPNYIPSVFDENISTFKNSILQGDSVHLYQPLISSNGEVEAYELKPLQRFQDQLYSNGLTRTEYLFEIRSIIEAIRLVHQYRNNSFLLEVSLSSELIKNNYLFDRILEMEVDSKVLNRIILTIRDSSNEENISKHLRMFSKLGFKISFLGGLKPLSLTFLNGGFDYFKVSLAGHNIKQIYTFSPLVIDICKRMNVKTMFVDITSDETKKHLEAKGVDLFQGDIIAKPTNSLMSSKFKIN